MKENSLFNPAAVILAGGQSQRMGQNKALLQWRGMRLIDYLVSVLKAAQWQHYHISGQIEGYTGISDHYPNRGPVAGICASIFALKSRYTHLLFIPVDLPLFNQNCLDVFQKMMLSDDAQAWYFAEYSQRSLDYGKGYRSKSEAVYRKIHNEREIMQTTPIEFEWRRVYPLPCALKIDTALLAYTQEVTQQLALTHNYSVKNYLKKLVCKKIPLSDQYRDYLSNMNTPEAWEKFYSLKN